MAFGIVGGMFMNASAAMPEMQLANLHPKGDAMPIWSLMFITVACGAISGFLGEGVGLMLAMVGVVICPITSGDTALRSARCTLRKKLTATYLLIAPEGLQLPLMSSTLARRVATVICFVQFWRTTRSGLIMGLNPR